MSFQITTAFVEQYRNNVMMLLQQKGSLLRNAVTTETVVGKNAFTEQIGAVSAVKRTSRHGDSPLISTPHARRRLSLVDYEWGDLIDDQDKVRLLIDPQSPYSQNAANAMGRAMDDEIITALNGTAQTGVSGGTSTSLGATSMTGQGAGQGVGIAFRHIGTNATTRVEKGLTIDKIIRARQLLMAAQVDPSEQLFFAVSATQVRDMLAFGTHVQSNAQDTPVFSSLDFNPARTLMEGGIANFMGFTFINTERLNVDSSVSTTRQCLAWSKQGIKLGLGKDIVGRVEERADKSFATYVYYSMSIGATRLEEERVVQIDCDET